MQFNRIVLVVYILLNLINYSYATTEDSQTMIRYYRGFYSKYYTHPVIGTDEILPEHIDKYENYYIAEIDKHENIISFKKILNRKCEFKIKYQYDASGNITKVINQDCEKEK